MQLSKILQRLHNLISVVQDKRVYTMERVVYFEQYKSIF